MTHRERVIEQLLDRYQDFADPVRSGNGDGTTGLLLMPHDPGCKVTVWNPPVCTCSRSSLVEIERLLRLMRDDRHRPLVRITTAAGVERKASVRSLWWHLTERYVRATVVIRDVPVTRKAKGGKRLRVVERRPVPQHNSDPELVKAGIGWLATNWAESHAEPMLPLDAIAA